MIKQIGILIALMMVNGCGRLVCRTHTAYGQSHTQCGLAPEEPLKQEQVTQVQNVPEIVQRPVQLQIHQPQVIPTQALYSTQQNIGLSEDDPIKVKWRQDEECKKFHYQIDRKIEDITHPSPDCTSSIDVIISYFEAKLVLFSEIKQQIDNDVLCDNASYKDKLNDSSTRFVSNIEFYKNCKSTSCLQEVYKPVSDSICEAYESLSLTQKLMQTERANPSGYVNKVYLHELGAESQIHSEDIRVLSTQYQKLTHKQFSKSLCK
jgi:hypothetical protein